MCWKVNVVNVANPRYHTPPVPLGFLKHQPCSCSSSSEMICKRSKQVGIRPIIIKPEYKELIVAWFFLGRYLKYDFKASLEKKKHGVSKKKHTIEPSYQGGSFIFHAKKLTAIATGEWMAFWESFNDVLWKKGSHPTPTSQIHISRYIYIYTCTVICYTCI